MHGKIYIIACCLFLVLVGGCSSKFSFMELLNNSREELSNDSREELSNDSRLAQEQTEELRQRLQELEEEREKCMKAKAKLDDANKTLQQTIHKKESLISIQERVIKLLDDPQKTLQKSIHEQLVEQNIEAEDL